MKDTSVCFCGQSSPSPYNFGRKHFARHLRRALRATAGDVGAALDRLSAAGRRPVGEIQIVVGDARPIRLSRCSLAGLVELMHSGEVHVTSGPSGRTIARRLPWSSGHRREVMLHTDFSIYATDVHKWWYRDRFESRRARRAA